MSTQDAIYKQALLSESSLDDENADGATLADARATGAQRTRKLRAGLLAASLILNVILSVSLASLYARFRNRIDWKGAPQVWSTLRLTLHSTE